jgi:dTDP-glucose 4,6-dehydratase
MSIKQFADAVLNIIDSPAGIEYRALPADDPKVRQPNIDKAKRVLGWEPKVSFEEGILPTIAYFIDVLGAEAKCQLKG